MARTSVLLGSVMVVFIACSKTNNTAPLVGKWQEFREVQVYNNPFTNLQNYDTTLYTPTSMEFRWNKTYLINGTSTGNYELQGDTGYILKPSGNIAPESYTYTIETGGILKTKKSGGDGEQAIILDPNNMGAFVVAKIQYKFADYTKVP